MATYYVLTDHGYEKADPQPQPGWGTRGYYLLTDRGYEPAPWFPEVAARLRAQEAINAATHGSVPPWLAREVADYERAQAEDSAMEKEWLERGSPAKVETKDNEPADLHAALACHMTWLEQDIAKARAREKEWLERDIPAKVSATPNKAHEHVRLSDEPMVLPSDSKARKDMPIGSGVLDYFPRAMAAVAMLSKSGNDKHNPGQHLHWAKEKSTDHPDCIIRHFMDRGRIDPDSGYLHDVGLAWRALANLEVTLEALAAREAKS